MAYEPRGIEYLRTKLAKKRSRCDLRYKFYEMKNIMKDLGIFDDARFRKVAEVTGWAAKAVDSLADRLDFRRFDNDDMNINVIFDQNNPDIFFSNAILSALITSCSFVYIRMDDEDVVRLEVIDGANATGVIDPVTYLLKEGYAVLERDDHLRPTIEAHFLPGQVTYYYADDTVEVFDNNVAYPLLVPCINRPDARRPFGHARITRAGMSTIDAAMRTLLRSEVTAEFYSFPQKWVSGLSSNREPLDKWKAAVSELLEFDKDQDGDHPVIGQFQQASVTPHLDQLKMLASMFAGENGLTLEDLGFQGANPTSAEGIKAAHETLRLQARKAQRDFSSAFLNIGFVAGCLRDNLSYSRDRFYRTKAVWNPIFEPDAAMLSGIGDGLYKIQQAYPDAIPASFITDLLGI